MKRITERDYKKFKKEGKIVKRTKNGFYLMGELGRDFSYFSKDKSTTPPYRGGACD